MNSIKAITQLEELRRDRLSFIQNSDSDEIYLNDIKAISLAVMALKKCPDIKDRTFNCRMCGKELKTWRRIQKGFGPVCEKKYINDVYKNQQLTMDVILQKKGEVTNGQQ